MLKHDYFLSVMFFLRCSLVLTNISFPFTDSLIFTDPNFIGHLINQSEIVRNENDTTLKALRASAKGIDTLDIEGIGRFIEEGACWGEDGHFRMKQTRARWPSENKRIRLVCCFPVKPDWPRRLRIILNADFHVSEASCMYSMGEALKSSWSTECWW